MTQNAEADPSARKFRERELYTIPISSGWFRWDEIHELERRSLPEFFDGGSYSRSPRVYKEYRDFMINKYREDPSRRLTFTEVRRSLVGDVCTLRKVFLFLEKYGLINFSVPDNKRKPVDDGGPAVVVELGPVEGLTVVPAVPSSSSSSSSSSAAAAATEQGEGEGGLKLPPLSSHSDAFGDWKPGSDIVCGCCGGCYRPGLNESLNGGYTSCSKCCSKKDTVNDKTEVEMIPDDQVDTFDQSSTVWTDAETLLLLEAVLKHGEDWDLIAQHVRTKNKLDCISRLIHLPFGEHMLGAINTKSSNPNLIATIEYKPVLHVVNENLPMSTETNSDDQYEFNKAKGIEIVSEDRPLKRRCFPPLTHSTDLFMKQVASLSTVCGPHVAAVAMDAIMKALCHENPYAKQLFETNGDKVAKPISPPHKHKSKSDTKDEEGDVMSNKQAAHVPEKNFYATTLQVRAAIATSLAVAAARAKLIADQEEGEMELLMASIIQAQLRKIQCKMKQLREMEQMMEMEFSCVRQMKERLLNEWVGTLRKLFCAGIPRWTDRLELPNPTLQ